MAKTITEGDLDSIGLLGIPIGQLANADVYLRALGAKCMPYWPSSAQSEDGEILFFVNETGQFGWLHHFKQVGAKKYEMNERAVKTVLTLPPLKKWTIGLI